jgi:hypothetical protein
MFPDDGRLLTDHRLNAHGAVTCANKSVEQRLRPVHDAVTATVTADASTSTSSAGYTTPRRGRAGR